ncbi:MAG: PQQ-binding-like beta-propeller repeat protein [Planctomycetota bacterium]|jgi:outer membrane protein assembly factor BamB
MTGFASDWACFQGDHERSGRAAGPALHTPLIRWRQKVGIQGYLNTPVLAGPFVFTSSSGARHNAPDVEDGIYALDRATGAIGWHRRTSADACGLTYAGGRLLAGTDANVLLALNAADGATLWSQALYATDKLYCRPLVVNDLVVVGVEGGLRAFDLYTGVVRWSVGTRYAHVRCGLACDGWAIYAVTRDGVALCVTLDGKVRWETLLDGEFYPSPTLAGDRVILGWARNTTYPTPALVALERASGAIVWTAQDRSEDPYGSWGNVRSSPAVWRDHLVWGEAYSNRLHTVRVHDGRAGWAVALGAKMFPQWASPVIAGDTVYLPRCDGALYAVDCATVRERWRVYLGEPGAEGRALPEAIARDAEPHGSWDPAMGAPLYSAPAVGRDGTIYQGTAGGWLYCLAEGR